MIYCADHAHLVFVGVAAMAFEPILNIVREYFLPKAFFWQLYRSNWWNHGIIQIFFCMFAAWYVLFLYRLFRARYLYLRIPQAGAMIILSQAILFALMIDLLLNIWGAEALIDFLHPF